MPVRWGRYVVRIQLRSLSQSCCVSGCAKLWSPHRADSAMIAFSTIAARLLVAADQRRGRQDGLVEHEAMHAVRKEHPVLRILFEVLVRLAGGRETVVQGVLVQGGSVPVVAHRVLIVPAVELEARAVGRAVACRVPVLPGPVPVAAPEVDDQVVDVIRHVQQNRVGGVRRAVGIAALQPLVGIVGCRRRPAQAEHLAPGDRVPGPGRGVVE